jgi:ubiquinone/menaquinone biosynthesis C-methylase UbiE
MAIIDKHGVLDRLDSLQVVCLELGCGAAKRHPDAIGIDVLDSNGVDVQGDVFEVLAALPSGSVDSVYSYHFMEHIESLDRLIQELARVLKHGAVMEVVVPHFSNPYYYSDPTHKRQFGLYTWSYYAKQHLFSRMVPRYGGAVHFELIGAELGFKSPRPFYARFALKRAWGYVINSCSYLQEFYEENLSFIVPCYEVRFVLKRRVTEP